MAINNPVITDSEWLQATAVAIQNKDGGSKMEVSDFASRIDALPTAPALISKTITENGVYNANSDNADGYDVVTVDVPDENILEKLCLNALEVADILNVTNVPDKLFFKKNNLINVIMPNAITIGESAFEGCTNLTLTTLPSGITSIANRGFTDCPNLTLTTLPSGITSMSNSAFRRCTNLALTSLPNGVTNIDDHIFDSCTNLALTSLPNGVTTIGEYAFNGCTNLALTSLPNGVTTIRRYAFYGCTGIPYLDFSGFMQIPTLAANNAFNATSFPFYFRDQQQLDEWAAATNWSKYASHFQIKPSGVS